MKNPLVSVVVPNYNYARFLDQRMESILNQTYSNFEVIILDDKSTDNSLEVIEKYRFHPKVSKIIINDLNSGSPFKQWEKGINEAAGEIIWIAESDDFCSPVFLETLVPLYETNEAVLAFCHSELVDEKGEKIRENHQMKRASSDFSMDGKAFIKEYLAYSNEIQNASCAIFSKKAAQEIDKDYMNYKGAGDWLFWIRIVEKGNVCFLNRKNNNYRLHINSTSSLSTNGVGLKEMFFITGWLRDNEYLDNKQYRKCRYNNLSMILSLAIIPRDVKKELFKMWDVTLYEIFKIRLLKIKSMLKLIATKIPL